MDIQDVPTVNITWRRLKDLLLDIHRHPEHIFYRIGLSIGTRPWIWLLATLCVSGICGPGLLFWVEEIDDVEVFIPKSSIIRSDANWVKEHFKDDIRYESILITANNIFEPDVLHLIAEIEESVKTIVVNNHTWRDVCAGYLSWFEGGDARSVEDEVFANEILQNLNSTLLKEDCVYQSLLKLWKNKGVEKVGALSREQILNDVSVALKDKVEGNILLDIKPLLSGIKYDSAGRVVGAKATLLNWMLKKSNPGVAEWELEFIQRVLFSNRTLPKDVEIYAVAFRSFKDLLHEVLQNNMTILCCGLSLIAVFVIAMIGRCNLVQQRIYLSLLGVSVVGQAIICSYGVCFYLGFFYGPVHPILPFLMLGIGVDDMFVIMQNLDNLAASNESQEDLPKRIAKSLERSGISISTTSITNVMAFAIGVTTTMPFLRSFCMFASMGILFLYIFEITFFVSCLVLDERRLDSRKDGCFCKRKPEWTPNECSQRNTQQIIFRKFVAPFVIKTPVKVSMLVLSTCILGFNILGLLKLEQNFDPLWYLNKDSYPIEFNDKLMEYFPQYGKRAALYMTGVDYYEDRNELIKLMHSLRENPYINSHTVDSWFEEYEKWLQNTNYDVEDRDEYYSVLTEFLLLTKEGQSHIKDIKFDKLPIGDYNITTSQIQIQHIFINTTSDQIRAMQLVRESVQAVNFSRSDARISLYSPDYVSWAANKVIGDELIRNLCLEILTVGLVTFVLLRDLQTSFWVICCVLCTLINLLGSMYYLGLTVEISSSIIILLCAGLSVDYAAHIALEYINAEGSRDEKTVTALSVIGPAVFNGGLSTFLAFILLGTSDAYLFSTFFKLFTSVVFYGLFHGLIILPIILSLVGPKKKPIIQKNNDLPQIEQNGYCTVHLFSHNKDHRATDIETAQKDC
ncbi:patched domain-containing protein 3 [Orussus abietinus]|uniref:patched domain-containing protein 3 n=1 Tax=Orussus abietinus TaxID=222816 RepID=UPI0006256210|nr:patched domain-containing protein 3 [Orussus abietinus]